MLDRFLNLMKGFLEEDLTAQEFVDRYLDLRRRVLKRAYERPEYKSRHAELLSMHTSGKITKGEFESEQELLSRDLWPEEFRSIRPFTVVGNILLDQLIVDVDAYGAPDEDRSIDEADLRAAVEKALREIQKAMGNPKG